VTKTLIKIPTTDTLTAGNIAPDFEAVDQDGKKMTLSQFKGKIVVLYFYPKDNTPGCTKEACSFRDRFSTFKKKTIIVIGVSKDNQNSHQNFIEKFDLPFPLISDTDKKVQLAYGVWKEKNIYGRKTTGTVRTTFIIGKEGKIAYVFYKVDCENHAEEILEKLEELNLI
jgi:peroxiredoxin Q/BCP